MNRFSRVMTAFVAFAVFASPAFAATISSPTYPVTASVDGSLSLNVTLRQNSSTGPVVTSMAFGQLQDTGNGTLRSSTTGPGSTGTGNVTAVIVANSHGVPYTVKQTGTALSNGTSTIPAGACTVVPVYAAADNGGAVQPASSVLGTPGTWVATDKPLYTSESGVAQMRTFQAIYSITDDPGAGATAAVPVGQPGGNYSATVTFTVTA